MKSNILKPITFPRSACFTWNQIPLTMKLAFSYNKLIHINKNIEKVTVDMNF